MMKIYSCDFETNNHEDNCFVWAAGAYEINSGWYKHYNNIQDFFQLLALGGKFYFHNLKFDGAFILVEVLRRGLIWTSDFNKLNPGQYSTIISDTKIFYAIAINLQFKTAYIYDSLKVIPAPVREIPKMFGLEETKGEIDYNKNRFPGYIMTPKEEEYLYRDCSIVGKGLKALFDEGLTQMTTASNAFKWYQELIGKKEYNRTFPQLKYDEDIRPSYKGGYCYVNENIIGENIGKGIVVDKNSMYPWVMKYKPLPFGEGIRFEGKYKVDSLYPLYIYQFRCQFQLKDGYLPTIQIKNGRMGFIPTEYLKSSDGKEVVLTMTNIDYDLFKKHYHILFEEPIGGYKFMCSSQLFKEYVEYWYQVKEDAAKNGNALRRTIAKLMLNALYGKFGSRIERSQSIPYLEDGIVKFSVTDKKVVKGKYLPVAAFITAYAREDVINAAQMNIDRFLYADTDSLHLIGSDPPKGIEVDEYKLGAWKVESKFNRARYIRAKRYLEIEAVKYKMKRGLGKYKLLRKGKIYHRWKEKLNVKCCGLPAGCHHLVTWENFRQGQVYGGKLQHRNVEGGAILKEINFTLM